VPRALLSALSAALTTPIDPLDRAAAVIRAAFGMDRVSLARMDPDAGRFQIVATDGAELLATGCQLPVATCTYFLTTARGEEFVERDFTRADGFDLPLDGVVQAAGFRAGGSAPVRVAGRTVGAISLSHGAPLRAMPDAVHDAGALGPMLVPHLARRAPARRPGLSPREREVLAALEEGLRFKQIALALGISQATAKTHGRHLFRKLDVTSRAEAVHAARTLGLL
jgi:DNA-binding CsgD family transcriptional regulator